MDVGGAQWLARLEIIVHDWRAEIEQWSMCSPDTNAQPRKSELIVPPVESGDFGDFGKIDLLEWMPIYIPRYLAKLDPGTDQLFVRSFLAGDWMATISVD